MCILNYATTYKGFDHTLTSVKISQHPRGNCLKATLFFKSPICGLPLFGFSFKATTRKKFPCAQQKRSTHHSLSSYKITAPLVTDTTSVHPQSQSVHLLAGMCGRESLAPMLSALCLNSSKCYLYMICFTTSSGPFTLTVSGSTVPFQRDTCSVSRDNKVQARLQEE